MTSYLFVCTLRGTSVLIRRIWAVRVSVAPPPVADARSVAARELAVGTHRGSVCTQTQQNNGHRIHVVKTRGWLLVTFSVSNSYVSFQQQRIRGHYRI